MHYAGQQTGNSDVKHCADAERNQNADGHIALRIFGFLRGGGNRIESDVSEENHPGPARDARPAELAEIACVWRNKRMPVGRGQRRMFEQIRGGNNNEHQHGADFDEDHSNVQIRRFLDADH